MPLLCTKKIPISNRSSHSSRDARARSLSLSLSFALSPLLTQHSGAVVVAVESVASVSLLVYFAGVFFVAESEQEHCWVKRARAMSGNLSTNRTVSASCLKFAIWKKCECVCACKSVSASLRVCVQWVQVADSAIYEGLTGQMSTTEISATTNWAQTQLNLTSSRVTSSGNRLGIIKPEDHKYRWPFKYLFYVHSLFSGL